MTTVQEVQKRNNKAQNLRVIRVEDAGDHFVSSEDGLILYKVNCGNGEGQSCTCGDFAKGSKNDPQFKCKHILALMNSEHDSENARTLHKAQPKLDPRFIVQIDGQDFVKYAGLLDLAHQKKMASLETEIIQYPTQENEKTAICKAHAKTAFGESFIDVGDANPASCNSKVSRHLIRMASTRAKARALRDLTNIGMTCMEELGDLDEVIGNEEKGTAQKGKVKPFPKKVMKAESPASQPNNGNGRGVKSADSAKNIITPQKEEKKTTAQPEAKVSEKPDNNGQKKTKTDTPLMSEAQKRAVFNLSRRRGISVEELEKMSTDTFGLPLDKLSASDAVSLIRNLQQSA
ncbi:MAG: SWIM zinc finger family protein [Deltaproteobacteria bacterium]|nr:SWIM zinc finger family protein [Deltaproteobacteria bacterium]